MSRRARSIAAAIGLSLLAALSSPLLAATLTVGGDAGCTHSTVQAAINAAQSAAEPSVIRISRNAAHLQQGLVANINHDLELSGGSATCLSAPDNTKTVLDGAGGANASVLRIIAGTDVTAIVRKLRIQNGDVTGEGAGGGIFFGGSGALEVRDSSVIDNIAGNGGGIYAGGAVPGAKLIIGADVVISGNEARFSGGGVFVDGLEMTMLEPGSIIANNSALGTSTTGYGGGLLVRGLDNPERPGIVRIGSRGIDQLGAISNNEARAGGGVAVLSDDENVAELELFSTVTFAPAAIRNNRATVAGGGVFVQAESIFGFGKVLVWNAEITGNRSPSGAAIYLANAGDGPALFINYFQPDGVLSCIHGVPCGAIEGNVAQEANGQLSEGAIIQFQDNAYGNIGSANAGIALNGNRGGRLIDVQPNAYVTLMNSALFDNELSQHLIRVQGDRAGILDSTIAGNTIGSGDVLAFNANLELRRSILWQPGLRMLSQSGGMLTLSSVIANETISLGGAPGAIIAAPRFIDPDGGDYRLRAASPAVDYAPAIAGDDRDISNSPRDQDLGLKPDASGPRDIGAFERPLLGPLTLNANFDRDIRLWQPVTPNSTTWDGTQSTGAPVPSGSAMLAATLAQGSTRLVGAKQCIHLPGPGRYKLNGYGMTTFATVLQRDSVVLHWALRRDGGEACESGSADTAGDHLLSRGSSFVTPSQPAVIDVPAEVWTANSSITVSLVVVDNGIFVPASVTGWFDRITLVAEPLTDLIFADGFE